MRVTAEAMDFLDQRVEGVMQSPLFEMDDLKHVGDVFFVANKLCGEKTVVDVMSDLEFDRSRYTYAEMRSFIQELVQRCDGGVCNY